MAFKAKKPTTFFLKKREPGAETHKGNESQEAPIPHANQYTTFINHYYNQTPPIMDVFSIAKSVASLFFPLLKKNKTIKQITSEITEASNNTLLQLWEKIKPIFIEEFEKDGKLSEDVESESVVAREIRKKIQDDPTIQQFLAQHLNALSASTPPKNITIIGGDSNAINTGNIKGNDGDVIIGGSKNKPS